MITVRAEGFPPVYNAESELLILGSFPSVKSRAVSFYYGNPQNRFWRMVCGFFGEEIPQDTQGKREFLLRNHIALWDVVTACTIKGSSDASISEVTVADIPSVLNGSNVREILCNGGKAYELLAEHFPWLVPMAKKLPSTSPANPRFAVGEWHAALKEVFGER